MQALRWSHTVKGVGFPLQRTNVAPDAATAASRPSREGRQQTGSRYPSGVRRDLADFDVLEDHGAGDG